MAEEADNETTSVEQTDKSPKKAKRKTAVAIGASDELKEVPKVLAAGRGEFAQKIIEWANKNDLAIERNTDLAQVLIQLDLGDSVPEEVFTAVAEILYYVHEINNSKKLNRSPEFNQT